MAGGVPVKPINSGMVFDELARAHHTYRQVTLTLAIMQFFRTISLSAIFGLAALLTFSPQGAVAQTDCCNPNCRCFDFFHDTTVVTHLL
jgi:hypothetical protein